MNRFWTKTLAGRFVLVLCATFLPLGILAFVVSCAVMSVSSERMYLSYERELEGNYLPLQESLAETEQDLDAFVLDHLSELTMGNDHEDILNYEMIRELGEILDSQQAEGVVYLFDRSKVDFFVDHNYEEDRYAEGKGIQNKLMSRGLPQSTTGGWQLYYFDQQCFLVHSYSFAGYYLGLLVDMNRFAENMELVEDLGVEEIYLGDDARIMRLSDGTASRVQGQTWEELITDPGNSRFLTWEGETLGCRVALRVPAFSFLERMGGQALFILGILLLEVLFIVVFWRLVKKWVVDPIDTMNRALSSFGQDYDKKHRITGIDANVSTDFRQMFENFNEMAHEVEEGKAREKQLYDMTLDNLKLRMNPHMLMNSLNLIYSMAQMEDYKNIQEFALCMTDYFRYVLKETRSLVTVKEEMDFVKSYLGIQKIRFPDRFSCVYSMPEDVEQALIPPLLIENFVENAVKYAVVPGKVTEILINIRKEEEQLCISITDTGRGIKPEVMPYIRSGRTYVDAMGKEHIGIHNCRKWIEYYYQGQGHLQITSTYGEGTQVWMEVPYLTKGEGEDADETVDRR